MTGRLTQFMAALLAAASLIVAPVYAQAQETQQQSPQEPASQQQNTPASQNPAGVQPPSRPQAQTGTPGDTVRDLRLGAGPDYSREKFFLPNILDPYRPSHVEEPMLTNSTRIDQLIQDGKLMLSLDDAISLALENNLNINVARFVPWIQQTQLLKAKAGGIPQFGNTQQVVLGSSPSVSFDPIVTAGLGWSHANIPVNNPFTAGTGTNAIPVVNENSAFVNLGYTQGFHTGADLQVTFNTTRSTSNEPDLFFNPAINPIMTATLSQPLLNGFGILPNTRYIIEARNNIKVANSQFAQQVIATVTQTSKIGRAHV